MVPDTAVFEAVRSRLRDRATIQYNLWMLLGRGKERSIADLAAAVWYPERPPVGREAQFRVGAFCSHLNKHLAQYDVAVKPGKARETYRTVRLSEWTKEREERLARRAAARAAAGLPPIEPKKWGFADPTKRAKWLEKARATRAKTRARKAAEKAAAQRNVPA